MSLNLSPPILYLITRGATTEATSRGSSEFHDILRQISAAIAAGIDLIQIREKKLSGRVLFQLAERAVEISHATSTRILINDRADIAAGAGAAGVHLTTQSLEAPIIRKTFGEEFLIGASTHSLDAACAARDGSVDFIVFGPIFSTPSKEQFGAPLGLQKLRELTSSLSGFPVLALGGISVKNAERCLQAGASGVAGISLFAAPNQLASVAERVREHSKGVAP